MAQPRLLQHKVIDTTITLAKASWSGKSYNATVAGLTANSIVFVQPDTSSATVYAVANVKATAQAVNKLTFSCTTVPTADVKVQIVIINGG